MSRQPKFYYSRRLESLAFEVPSTASFMRQVVGNGNNLLNKSYSQTKTHPPSIGFNLTAFYIEGWRLESLTTK